MTDPAQDVVLHASCVAAMGRGLLILGPSGAGKSALALRLMALGARLVSDDRTQVLRDGATLRARCPSAAIRGLVEARGFGILRAADPLDDVPLALAVDLGQEETARLPPHRTVTILGIALPLAHHVRQDHFPAALMLYLAKGRQD